MSTEAEEADQLAAEPGQGSSQPSAAPTPPPGDAPDGTTPTRQSEAATPEPHTHDSAEEDEGIVLDNGDDEESDAEQHDAGEAEGEGHEADAGAAGHRAAPAAADDDGAVGSDIFDDDEREQHSPGMSDQEEEEEEAQEGGPVKRSSLMLDLDPARRFSINRSSAHSRQTTSRAQHSGRSSRPLSSTLMEALRGTRPSSAAIAAHIEGFGDDFDEGCEEQLDVGATVEEEADQPEEPSPENLLALAREEQADLMAANEMLQRRLRVALDVRNKGRQHGARDLSRLDGADARFRSMLQQWSGLQEERARLQGHYSAVVLDMQGAYEGRAGRAAQVRSAYRQLVAEVAASSEHSQSGRPLSMKDVLELQQQEEELDNQVQLARLKALHGACALRRLERSSTAREHLAEGLHLIDFEQLKIENQSLNERIEEKNEQLLALRKKTTQNVLVLSHLKEKLQFVERQGGQLQGELVQLEAQVAAKRAELQGMKQERDGLRAASQRVRDSTSTVSSPALLEDMKRQGEIKLELRYQVEQLQEQQEEAVARNAATAARIAEAMQELASSSGCSVAQVQAMLKSLKPSSKAGSPSSTSKAGSGSLKAGASGAVVSKGAVAGGSGPMLGSGGLPLGVRSLKR